VRRQIKGSGLTVTPVGLDGASPYRIALAWFLHKGPPIIPILGASKIRSVRDSAEAVHIKLAHEDIEAIDALPESYR